MQICTSTWFISLLKIKTDFIERTVLVEEFTLSYRLISEFQGDEKSS